MRTLFVLLLLAIPLTADSQPTAKQVLCYELTAIVKILTEDYQETVQFNEINTMTTGSRIALAENTETGTWTVFEYDRETACILGMGQRQPAQRL